MNSTDTAELIRVARDATEAGVPLDTLTGRPHECNVRCQGVEHVSLIYAQAGLSLDLLLADGRFIYRGMSIILIRYEHASEYPPFSTTALHAMYRAQGYALMEDSRAEAYLLVWRYRKGRVR